MLFPSSKGARRCADFINNKNTDFNEGVTRIVNLVLDLSKVTSETLKKLAPSISVVVFPQEIFPVAKQYWQHSGDGISSRRAEFCHGLLQEDLLVDKTTLRSPQNEQQRLCKGPKRYQRGGSIDKTPSSLHGTTTKPANSHDKLADDSAEAKESSQFVEERFGRNLNMSLIDNARSAIRRRIAGSLTGDIDLTAPLTSQMEVSTRGVTGLSEEDVYLYPCGMNAIFHTHQMMLQARGPLKSICFGFPYVDTLKILEKFGPGCLFYGNGSSEDLDDLEQRLKSGEKYLALFSEFPGNPLLKSADLQRIKRLADAYDFGIVIDETVGNFINVHVLPFCDVVVSSLTKVFTGECNVMGGSGILNPDGKYYKQLKEVASSEYEDNYWAEDVIFMERNSRDFVSRIDRINHNAEIICDILKSHPLVKAVYYPKYAPSKQFYDACRTPTGGYGGLLSVTFPKLCQAVAFFDRIDTAKGPSLGTNFTLTSPYTILAHYTELDWAASFGVDPNLIRISVGLEDTEKLKGVVLDALNAAEKAGE
jgi:cystathionine gamma-synthase